MSRLDLLASDLGVTIEEKNQHHECVIQIQEQLSTMLHEGSYMNNGVRFEAPTLKVIGSMTNSTAIKGKSDIDMIAIFPIEKFSKFKKMCIENYYEECTWPLENFPSLQYKGDTRNCIMLIHETLGSLSDLVTQLLEKSGVEINGHIMDIWKYEERKSSGDSCIDSNKKITREYSNTPEFKKAMFENFMKPRNPYGYLAKKERGVGVRCTVNGLKCDISIALADVGENFLREVLQNRSSEIENFPICPGDTRMLTYTIAEDLMLRCLFPSIIANSMADGSDDSSLITENDILAIRNFKIMDSLLGK